MLEGKRGGVARTLIVAALITAGLVAATNGAPSSAATVPPGFVEDIVATDSISEITAIDFLPDGRIVVAEKPGRLKIVDATDPTSATTALDISSAVNSAFDRGLMGVAIDPDFTTTERVYLASTYDPPEVDQAADFWDGDASPGRLLAYGQADGFGQRVTRVTSWQLDPASGYTSVVANSEVLVLGANSTWTNIGDPFAQQSRNDVPWPCISYGPGDPIDGGDPIDDCLPQDGFSHQVGALRFAPDGALWLSHGDAASFSGLDIRTFRSLDLDQTPGKLLRFDKLTGHGLADNPHFTGDPTHTRSKVWASGLRNPFRFTFHESTGDVYIGDIGLDRFEEINLGVAGASYGWPCFEGGLTDVEIGAGVSEGPGTTRVQPGFGAMTQCDTHAASDQVAPFRSYCHDSVDAAVCASGGLSSIAAVVVEGVAYPPEFRGLWYGDIVAGWTNVLDLSTGEVTPVSSDLAYAVDWAMGPDGNVHYVSRGLDQVVRLRYTGGPNQQPTAVASADPTSGPAPLAVQFSSAGSTDTDGTIDSYAWNFDDGTFATGPSPTHTFTAGTYGATLTVTDDRGGTASATVQVTSGNSAPVATIASPSDDITVTAFSDITLAGSALDAEDGNLTGTSLVWSGVLHHNDHTHDDAYAAVGAVPPPLILGDHADDTYLEICLTATDSGGLSGTDCVDVRPTEVLYSFETDPAGLRIVYEGQEFTTPASVMVPVGVTRSIDVAAPQGEYDFAGWSIGGSQAQVISIGATNQQITATFATTANPGPVINEPASALSRAVRLSS